VNVLVIPEDPTLDEHVLQPVIAHVFRDLERPARVRILKDPHLRGAAQALDPAVVAAIVRDNPMEQIFVLVVDRDCNRMGNEEKAAARVAEHAGKLVACLAFEEVEVWMLALHRERLAMPWREIRAECDPKERFAEDLLDQLGRDTPGHGRKGAMRGLGARWKGLLQMCPELEALKNEIDVLLTLLS
jgi:hypothetical protein